jgi:hypothetical protein
LRITGPNITDCAASTTEGVASGLLIGAGGLPSSAESGAGLTLALAGLRAVLVALDFSVVVLVVLILASLDFRLLLRLPYALCHKMPAMLDCG